MKNYSFLLVGCLFVFSSCSFWKASEDKTAYRPSPTRGLASSLGQSCNGLMDQFLQRPMIFSEASFAYQLNELGAGYVLKGVRDLSQKSDDPVVFREIASKMEDHLRKGLDMRVLVDELSNGEKRAIWNGLVRPQMYEVEEQVLAAQAQKGDEVARFLLAVPQGVQRDNAESAVVLMKKIDPSIDNQTIVARLYRELGTCLTK